MGGRWQLGRKSAGSSVGIDAFAIALEVGTSVETGVWLLGVGDRLEMALCVRDDGERLQAGKVHIAKNNRVICPEARQRFIRSPDVARGVFSALRDILIQLVINVAARI